MPSTGLREGLQMPRSVREQLLPVARRVFWGGRPEEWLEDTIRFAAQVMTYGDWDDVRTAQRLLGDAVFCQALTHPPPGVFDIKSWTFWHHHYRREVPALPRRNL